MMRRWWILDRRQFGRDGVNYAVTFTEGGAAVTLSIGDRASRMGTMPNLEAAAVNPHHLDEQRKWRRINNAHRDRGRGLRQVCTGAHITLTGPDTLANYRRYCETVHVQ